MPQVEVALPNEGSFTVLCHNFIIFIHAGDMVRYYLYLYTSEAMSEEEDMGTTDADSSVSWGANVSQVIKTHIQSSYSSLIKVDNQDVLVGIQCRALPTTF